MMSRPWLLVSVSLLFLPGCVNSVDTRILPREDGSISAVSVGREEAPAASSNVTEANAYCEKQGRTAVFGEERTEYRGVFTKRGEALAKIAKRIPEVGGSVISDDDYRVTTSFKCVSSE